MLYAIIAVICIIADQLIKYYTVAHITLNEGIKALIPGVVHMTYLQNTGAAFSFMAGSSASRIVFVVLCVVVCAVLITLMAKGVLSGKGSRWCAVLVMAGAIGNAIDRLVSGYVVDMFEFEFFSFPVFNLADIFITLGGILFCLFVILEGRTPKAKREVEAYEEEYEEEPEPEEEPEIEEEPEEEEVKPAPRKVFAAKAVDTEREEQLRKVREYTPAPRKERPAPRTIDVEDPFAEWERRMGLQQEAPKAEPVSAETRIFRTVSDAPVQKAAPAPKAEPQAEMPRAKHVAPEVTEAPAAPAAAPAPAPAPKAEPAMPKAAPASGDEFDLDSILAEFGSGVDF